MYNNKNNSVKNGSIELLVFALYAGQKFGINVFKVKEILECPRIHAIPNSHNCVKGVINVRNSNIVLIDLNKAIGGNPIDDTKNKFVIVAEFNKHIIAFLVHSVDKIIQFGWEHIKEPPSGLGSNYLTAIAKTDTDMIQILDVEKVLIEICPPKYNIDPRLIELAPKLKSNQYVMIVDDSRVARKQMILCLNALNIPYKTFENGTQALNHIKQFSAKEIISNVPLIISDIEMPEMDGYTLTKNIKKDPTYNALRIMLHTSITGVFNKALVDSAGADDFICKFDPNDLSESIIRNIK